MYDPVSGGCRDGLHIDRLNENQGAESTLAFIQSMLEMEQFASETTEHQSKDEHTLTPASLMPSHSRVR
jgi:hypothetical protein